MGELLNCLEFMDGVCAYFPNNNRASHVFVLPGDSFQPVEYYSVFVKRRLKCSYDWWKCRWGK